MEFLKLAYLVVAVVTDPGPEHKYVCETDDECVQECLLVTDGDESCYDVLD